MRVTAVVKKMVALLVLFSAVVFAQDLPKIAVYVTGDVPDSEKKALGTKILAELVNSGRYIGIERSTAFLAEIDKEHVKQRSGAIDDKQISQIGVQFGVKYVCIADITPALGAFQISARVVDVETAQVTFIGEANSSLKTLDDLASVSEQVVKKMFGEGERKSNDNVEPDAIARKSKFAIFTKKKSDPVFLALKYQPPVATPISWGGVGLEFGFNGTSWRLWDIGFCGMEINAGWMSKTDNADTAKVMTIGIALNLGVEYVLLGQLDFVYGVSAGWWAVAEDEYTYENYNNARYVESDFLAPFVKLRWKFVELTYKGLLGYNEIKRDFPDYDVVRSAKFNYRHLLMLGFYFNILVKED
jgi:hypothetical protein